MKKAGDEKKLAGLVTPVQDRGCVCLCLSLSLSHALPFLLLPSSFLPSCSGVALRWSSRTTRRWRSSSSSSPSLAFLNSILEFLSLLWSGIMNIPCHNWNLVHACNLCKGLEQLVPLEIDVCMTLFLLSADNLLFWVTILDYEKMHRRASVEVYNFCPGWVRSGHKVGLRFGFQVQSRFSPRPDFQAMSRIGQIEL